MNYLKRKKSVTVMLTVHGVIFWANVLDVPQKISNIVLGMTKDHKMKMVIQNRFLLEGDNWDSKTTHGAVLLGLFLVLLFL